MKILIGILLFFNSLLLVAQQTVTEVGPLPDVIDESSGLIFFNGRLLTHNDSGNSAILYELDTLSLEIVRQVSILNVENNDWEAITQDENYIYIGDIGNNKGTRQNLAIYRITKEAYLESDKVTAENINFVYEGQEDFNDNGDSNWDAEALVVIGEQLVIFTKQWQSNGTVAYAIPNVPGDHIATAIATLNDIGLVTDASYDIESNELYLLGYSSMLTPFLLKYTDVSLSGIFNNPEGDIDLGLSFVQTEGIVKLSDNEFFITSEYFSRQSPSITSEARVFKVEIIEKLPQEPIDLEEGLEGENKVEEHVIIYKDLASDAFLYEIKTKDTIKGISIFDCSGRLLWSFGELDAKGSISNIFPSLSIYYFTVYLNSRILSVPFVRY
ncbi:hypothetical protein [Maribacter thermophilus]|uniref:hypothetical protein n=1 Tax=Maribacter thermophilus TaxID=1197874 RepID=UPI00069C9DEC|nr:hypothetical protein [Maribacter thermophilus]